MRVNSINSNRPFKRAVIVKSPNSDCKSDGIDRDVIEICGVINGKSSKIYSAEDADKIKTFFSEILGDISPKKPVIVETSMSGDTVLLSGKEADYLKSVKARAKRNIENHKRNSKISNSTRDELVQREKNSVKNAVQYKMENGRFGKPESTILFNSFKTPDKKSDLNVHYYSVLKTYASPNDGFVDMGVKESRHPRKGYYFNNLACDYFELTV